MSRRRNGTNRAGCQLGLNRYKLGKKKNLPAATGQAQEHIKINYNAILPQNRRKDNAVNKAKN